MAIPPPPPDPPWITQSPIPTLQGSQTLWLPSQAARADEKVLRGFFLQDPCQEAGCSRLPPSRWCHSCVRVFGYYISWWRPKLVHPAEEEYCRPSSVYTCGMLIIAALLAQRGQRMHWMHFITPLTPWFRANTLLCGTCYTCTDEKAEYHEQYHPLDTKRRYLPHEYSGGYKERQDSYSPDAFLRGIAFNYMVWIIVVNFHVILCNIYIMKHLYMFHYFSILLSIFNSRQFVSRVKMSRGKMSPTP